MPDRNWFLKTRLDVVQGSPFCGDILEGRCMQSIKHNSTCGFAVVRIEVGIFNGWTTLGAHPQIIGAVAFFWSVATTSAIERLRMELHRPDVFLL